jgi:hypothetical protein
LRDIEKEYKMTIAYNPKTVTNGLVLCLDAANPKSYPGTGTTWTDLSNNGNTGTLVNSVGYSSNNKGALTFDGVNDYVSTPFTYQNNNDFTMSCWFRTSVTQRCGLMGLRRAYRANDWYQTQCYITGDNLANSSGNYLNFDDFNLSGSTFSARRGVFINNIIVTDNSWRNVVITSNSTGARIYYNSVKVGENLTTPSPTRLEAVTFTIGAASNWPNAPLSGYYFNGNMSNVNFYNRALTAAEISQNFEALRGRYGI